MSNTIFDLPKSNFMYQEPENIEFFMKIGDQLIQVSFLKNQTVKTLNAFLEKKLKIPLKSQFLSVKSCVLSELDVIGHKILKNSIVMVNLKLLGGMIDKPYSEPHHSTELILLDNRNKPLTGEVFDPENNIKNLPTNFICRIYTDIGCGTGFSIKTENGEFLIITAKHVVMSCLGKAKIIAACFETNQVRFGRYLIYNFEQGAHDCRPTILELKIVDFELCDPQSQIDPITNNLYSIHNDIVALRPTGKCICGNPNQLFVFNHVNISSTPPNGSSIIVFGFPGIFTEKSRAFSVSEYVSNSDLEAAKVSFRTDVAMHTEGEILEKGIISCISASSIGGMSGSPMLWLDNGEWKIAGILLGGPAVPGHRMLLNILDVYQEGDDDACKKLIKEMKKVNLGFKKISRKLFKKFKSLPKTIKRLYFKEIKREGKQLAKQNLDSKQILNHNLVYDCFNFIGTLININRI